MALRVPPSGGREQRRRSQLRRNVLKGRSPWGSTLQLPAVAEGFEPSVTCATLAFEVCSCRSALDLRAFNLVHSRTRACRVACLERLWTGVNETETETLVGQLRARLSARPRRHRSRGALVAARTVEVA